MRTAKLHGRCGVAELVSGLETAGALTPDWPSLVIDLEKGTHFDVAAMSFLCAWLQGQAPAGRRIHINGDGNTIRYLARMGLHRHAGMDFKPGNWQAEVGRFFPLTLVQSDSDVVSTVDSICDLVLHQFDNATQFLPAMEWAVNEIVDNIIIHSETVVPGVVCAQYFQSTRRLDIGICDLGRGIMASLGTSRKLWGHGDAVKAALQRGVTRDPDIGQGNGMAGALEITSKNGGEFTVWTGDVVYRLSGGKELGFTGIPTVPGTGIKFSLQTDRPVDLSQTWIAGGDWSFINAEAERIEEAGGIDVGAVCINTGSRPPATRLRRKVAALVPEMNEPLLLNFSAVGSASSSFLDELLGRLALQFGKEVFDERIRVAGMNPLVRKITNVVVAQRLGLDGGLSVTDED